jgi:hypothetical protein
MPEQPMVSTSASSMTPFLMLSVSLQAPCCGSAPADAVRQAGNVLYFLGLDPFALFGDRRRAVVRALGRCPGAETIPAAAHPRPKLTWRPGRKGLGDVRRGLHVRLADSPGRASPTAAAATPSYPGDAAIGEVAASRRWVSLTGHLPAAHVLDAAGRVLTPGFVDIHRHGDAALFRPEYGLAGAGPGDHVGGQRQLRPVRRAGWRAPTPRSCERVSGAYTAPVLGPLPPEGRFADPWGAFPGRRHRRCRCGSAPGHAGGHGGALRAGAAGLGDGPRGSGSGGSCARCMPGPGAGAGGRGPGRLAGPGLRAGVLLFTSGAAHSGAGAAAGLRHGAHRPHAPGGGRRGRRRCEEMLAAARALRYAGGDQPPQGHRPAELGPARRREMLRLHRPGPGGGRGRDLRRVSLYRGLHPAASTCCRRSAPGRGHWRRWERNCAPRLRDGAFRAALRRRIETGARTLRTSSCLVRVRTTSWRATGLR